LDGEDSLAVIRPDYQRHIYCGQYCLDIQNRKLLYFPPQYLIKKH